MKRILVINGPNLNFLGIRNPKTYGTTSYESLVSMLREKAASMNIELDIYQSNIEGEIINKLQEAYKAEIDGIIINPGAYSHYSYAIRDALEIFSVPVIEVHISNIYSREEFRHTSVISPVCTGQISGLGVNGYLLALEACESSCK